MSHFGNALPFEMWHGLGLPGLERAREPVRSSAQHGGVLITPEFEKIRISRPYLVTLQFWAHLGPQETLSLKVGLGGKELKYWIPDFQAHFSLSSPLFKLLFLSTALMWVSQLAQCWALTLPGLFLESVVKLCLWHLHVPLNSSWNRLLLKWSPSVLVTFLLLW